MNLSHTAGKSRMMSVGGDLLLRFGSAIVLAAVALASAWYGGWPAALVVAAAATIVHVEWIALTEVPSWRPAIFTAGVAVAIIVAAAGWLAIGLGLIGVAIAGAAITGRGVWRPLGVAYAAALGFGLLVLRFAPELGLAAIIVLFAIVWASDTGAFVAGRLIGGPKLWPRVSPGKTWAGAGIGLAAAVAAGLAAAGYFGLRIGANLVVVVTVLGIAAQAGDLFESWVKRRFGAKDSGRLIPGHGGLMDRVDGLVFAAALAAVIGWLSGGAAGVARGMLQW